MITTNKLAFIVGAFVATASVAVTANPVGLKFGPGVRFFPALGAAAVYDDNFFATADDEEGVAGVIVTPSLRIISTGTRSNLELGANAEIGDYDNGSRDDYVDSQLFANLNYDAATRHRFFARVARLDEHDAFGLRRTQGLPLTDRSLDEYHDNDARVRYRYGVPDALINLEYEFSYRSRQYDTNRSEGTEFLDFEYYDHRATSYFNYSPKTAVALRVSNRDIDYPNVRPGFPSREAREQRAAIGMEWAATAKTTGQVYVGVLQREPDSPAFDKFTGVDWDARIEWQPRRPAVFSVAVGRETDESFLLNASFINTKKYGIAWRQQWSRVLSTKLGSTYYDREFEDLGRKDDYYRTALDIELAVSRSFVLVGNLAYMDRESTEAAREFEKTWSSIGFRYTP